MIGGGHIGCETALYLVQQGKKLTIVEILDNLALDMFTANRMHLLKLLADAGVEILTDTKVLKITDGVVLISDKHDKKRRLATDSVVVAVGLEPQTEFWEALRDNVADLYAIGDCVEPRKVIDAIWEGFRIARLI